MGGMSHPVDELLDRIEAASVEVATEELLRVAFVMHLYVMSGSVSVADAEFHGWSPEVTEMTVDARQFERAQALMDSAIGALDEDPDRQASAVWVLGKSMEPGHQARYEELLRTNVDDGDPNVLFQAMIALNNLGIDFENEGSFSVADVERNREVVRAYLDRSSP